MLKATTGGGGDRQIPEAGMNAARCVAVLDLGTHVDERFKNDKGKASRRHLVQIQWELPGQMMTYEGESRPMMATKRYNLSVNEKATLRKDLESWYGKAFPDAELEAKGFDVEKLLGRPALLNLTHSDDGKYANVKSVNPPMKGVEQAPQINQSRFFDLESPSPTVWATLSQKTRDFIQESEEVKTGKVTLPGDPGKQKPVESLLPVEDSQESGSFVATDEDVPFMILLPLLLAGLGLA